MTVHGNMPVSTSTLDSTDCFAQKLNNVPTFSTYLCGSSQGDWWTPLHSSCSYADAEMAPLNTAKHSTAPSMRHTSSSPPRPPHQPTRSSSIPAQKFPRKPSSTARPHPRRCIVPPGPATTVASPLSRGSPDPCCWSTPLARPVPSSRLRRSSKPGSPEAGEPPRRLHEDGTRHVLMRRGSRSARHATPMPQPMPAARREPGSCVSASCAESR